MVKKGCLCLLLLLMIHFTVSAQDTSGSITLVMRCQGSTVSGGTVTLYNITDLNPALGPEELMQRVSTIGITGITQEIGNDGMVFFDNLETGYYLLVQKTAAPGYRTMKPFCVSVPITLGEQTQYEVEAFPKLERTPETELPQTGQLHLPVWGLMGSGLLMAALGILLQKRK